MDNRQNNQPENNQAPYGQAPGYYPVQPGYAPPGAPYPQPNYGQPNLPGTKMLHVVGILLAIFSGISVLSTLSARLGGEEVLRQSLAMLTHQSHTNKTCSFIAAVMISNLTGLISSAFLLTCGILGIIWRNRVEKAQALLVLGIIMIALTCVGGLISMMVISKIAGFLFAEWLLPIIIASTALSLIFGLVLPILYTIGATWNKKVDSI